MMIDHPHILMIEEAFETKKRLPPTAACKSSTQDRHTHYSVHRKEPQPTRARASVGMLLPMPPCAPNARVTTCSAHTCSQPGDINNAEARSLVHLPLYSPRTRHRPAARMYAGVVAALRTRNIHRARSQHQSGDRVHAGPGAIRRPCGARIVQREGYSPHRRSGHIDAEHAHRARGARARRTHTRSAHRSAPPWGIFTQSALRTVI